MVFGYPKCSVHRLVSSGNRSVISPINGISSGKSYSVPEFLRKGAVFCILAI